MRLTEEQINELERRRTQFGGRGRPTLSHEEFDALLAEVRQARKLEPFARHRNLCNVTLGNRQPCDCGLSEALKAL